MIYKKAIICKTKNLFSTSTEVGTLSDFSNTTPRQFEEGKWYIGISGNNYYAPNNIVEYELTENYVYINTIGSGYGIGRAFKCEPNQTYTVSCKWIKNTTTSINIATGFFDENGNLLSWIGAGYLGKRLTVTTPANCKWFTVCFVGSTGSTYVYNIQLEEGSTPTNYVPYGYLQSYKKAIKVSDVCQLVPISDKADGVVKGVTFTNNHNGTWTLSGTSTAATSYYNLFRNMPLRQGHIYLSASFGDISNAYSEIQWINKDGAVQWGKNPYTADENSKCNIGILKYQTNVDTVVLGPQFFDLTEMYGAGNEPKTIAEFRQKFPNDLYPYRPYYFVNSYKKYLKIKENNNA